tara:strand:- start:266 stop:436 length:171 start_codon:yes stop_codon:yes gene_type:complete
MSLRLGFGIGIPMGNPEGGGTNPEEFYIVSQAAIPDEFITTETNADLMVTENSPLP